MRIDDIAGLQAGYQFRQQLERTPFGTHQVIQGRDIDPRNDHRLDVGNLWQVDLKDADTSKYEVDNGDVVFLYKGNRNFATMIEGLGSAQPPQGAQAPCYRPRTIVPGYFLVLRLKHQCVRPAYLVWAINEPTAQAYLRSKAQGSGMPSIPREAFANLEIEVPPMETQDRIVALHHLSFRESRLLDRLRDRQVELVRRICRNAAKHDNQSGVNHGKEKRQRRGH
jgi:hypothetical protein